MGVLQDFFSGNFSGVIHDIAAAFSKLPAPIQAFIAKAESDEGKLLSSLATTALTDVVAGGFTTASFVAAGKAVVAQAASQGKTILISDAMAELNIQASAAQTAAAQAPATVAAPAAPCS